MQAGFRIDLTYAERTCRGYHAPHRTIPYHFATHQLTNNGSSKNTTSAFAVFITVFFVTHSLSVLLFLFNAEITGFQIGVKAFTSGRKFV